MNHPTIRLKNSLLRTIQILILSVFLFSKAQAQEETLLLRNPDISDQHITFVYSGDVWMADRSGENPRRITGKHGVEQNPLFSPYGQQLAFIGNSDGNTDVYIVSIYGGTPKRVTFHPTADMLRGWLYNNE